MRWSLIVVISLLVSCKQETGSMKYQLESIENWELINFETHEIDTNGVLNWIPQPSVTARFRHSGDSNCLTPQFDFYPIELKDYVRGKLKTYLFSRSTLYPPSPITYENQEYFITGWNFTSYDTFTCCSCNELEAELIGRLKLRKTLTSLPQSPSS
jgi:hypothetical protein